MRIGGFMAVFDVLDVPGEQRAYWYQTDLKNRSGYSLNVHGLILL